MSLSFAVCSPQLGRALFLPIVFPAASAWLPGGPLQVFTDNKVVTTNPHKPVDPLPVEVLPPGPAPEPALRARAHHASYTKKWDFLSGSRGLYQPTRKTAALRWETGSGGERRPQDAPDGWEEAPPGPPGGLLIAWQICRHCRVVMAGAGGKRRPREREDRPPQALAGLRGGPSCGGGGLTPAPQETQARRQLCRNPELSPHCTATCEVPARPSPSGRPPPAGPVSFPCAVCIPCSRGTGQPGQGVAGWWGGLHSQPPPH